ncbi:putative outer membrane lipoprotein [Aeromicrobium panaciterrae]|uniref:Outer membrane lipoprotein n=1 Tax=Aeromicrobium panaciterrae TaxID=363861 RepID=A0ABU1UQ24_9ACTN|nr:hypothetical protein [Aeromicrobium panaciterrae]MDR7087245.1 putative outer membrane lipoprotein [Aeromicrobium panaciterrae]
MRSRRTAGIFCGGVMVAAMVAWVVGADTSHFDYSTFDNLVGGAGVAACAFAVIAAFRSSWARVPLVAAFAVAALLADARFSDSTEDGIDLTPILLPPVIFFLGSLALLITAMSPGRDKPTPAAQE